MYDAARMCVGESACNVTSDADDFGGRHRTRRFREPIAKRTSLDERHGVPWHPFEIAGREHRDDVRLLQSGGNKKFAAKPLERQFASQLGRQHLERHAAAQRHLLGSEYTTHAAPAQFSLEPVCGP